MYSLLEKICTSCNAPYTFSLLLQSNKFVCKYESMDICWEYMTLYACSHFIFLRIYSCICVALSVLLFFLLSLLLLLQLSNVNLYSALSQRWNVLYRCYLLFLLLLLLLHQLTDREKKRKNNHKKVKWSFKSTHHFWWPSPILKIK